MSQCSPSVCNTIGLLRRRVTPLIAVLKPNESEPGFLINLLLHVFWILDENQLAGGTHFTLQQMTAVSRSIGASHYRMRVDLGFLIF